MKDPNLLTVLDALRKGAEMSRASVARATRMSSATASKTVRRLVEAGLIEERRTRGRVAGAGPRVQLNADYGAVLGIDLGGTHLRLALADFSGGFIARTTEVIGSDSSPAAILARIELAGKALIREHGARLLAIGLATPGVVDSEAGVVRVARNLQGWRTVPVRNLLESAFGVPVVVENDVNAAALGESWRGAARGQESVLFIAVGTGVGAGLVLNGEIFRGAHFAAGEINRLPVGTPDSPEYLEDRASGPAIVLRAVEFGYTPTEGEQLTTDAVFGAAAAGNVAARRAVDEAVHAIAFGAGVLLAAVDPSVVVLGGGVSSQGNAFLDPVKAAIAGVVRLYCDVVLSELGVDAQLFGAVFVGLKRADLAQVDRINSPTAGAESTEASPPKATATIREAP